MKLLSVAEHVIGGSRLNYKGSEYVVECSLEPGRAGTLREVEKYGDDLVCVRWRSDPLTGVRLKTVELVVETSNQTSEDLPGELPVLIKDAEVAALTGFTIRTLAEWRHKRWALPYVKCGSAVRYRTSDVIAYCQSLKHSRLLPKKQSLSLPSEIAIAEMPEELTTKQLSSVIGISRTWLTVWRSQGGGPVFVRHGQRSVVYRRDDVEQWLKKSTIKPARVK